LKHPNIITIFEEGELSGYPYIAMEYVDGGTLSDYIKNKGVLAEDEVKGIIIPILEALEYAHRTGIVHRDIKSTNILLESGGRPVLMDFGIAKSREGTKLTMAGTVIGTPEYMSPEQAKGQAEIDHRTDIYSIGVVMYEMVTGSVPYKGDTTLSVLHQVVNSRPVNPEDLNRNVSKVFSRIILKAMSKNPSDRYQNGSAFLADFCISEKAAPEKTMNLNEGQKALERETVVIAEKDKDSLKTRKISEDVKEAKEYRKTVKHKKN
jgi:serine/threonine-protein kinase